MTITLRFVPAVLLCLAFAPLSSARVPPKKAIVAYVFVKDAVLGANDVAAGSLTRVNYAFANIENGKIVEGFAHDRENFQVLHNLKQVNPKLEIVVSGRCERFQPAHNLPAEYFHGFTFSDRIANLMPGVFAEYVRSFGF